jgi:hypothetical protein
MHREWGQVRIRVLYCGLNMNGLADPHTTSEDQRQSCYSAIGVLLAYLFFVGKGSLRNLD